MSIRTTPRSAFDIILMNVCLFQALALFSQSALVGNFLSGTDRAVRLHEIVGWAAFVIALIQLILLLTPRGRSCGLWFLMSSVAVVLGEALQLGSGYGRFLRVHIPLAVVIVGGVTWQIIWLAQHRSSKPETVGADS